MEYNTTRGKLILPEYGRNVQNMIAHAQEIENREERNRAAQAIIEVMGQLNPHLRDVEDFKHKLWTHLFVMSDFNLDVDSPYEIPKQEVLNEKPKLMEYPKSKIKYGHYGKYTEKILLTAKQMESQDEKEFLKNTMATFMKKLYLAHNNDAVENHVIAEHLKELSHGELVLENPDELASTNTLLRSMGMGNNNNNKKFNKNFKQKRKFKK
ncbi:MAG: hypothetical protein RL264_2775 [Bacteroidota bacterium]|jgi:hypothetical protein